MVTTSKNINLAQLTKELGGKGLVADFTDESNKVILPADGVTLTDKQLSDAIAAHTPEDASAAKAALLTKLGITAEEAKLLLS